MNLTQSQLQELNDLLKSSKLYLPSYRCEVSSSGNNFHWLRKNITKKNNNVPKRILELLNLV